MEKKIGDRTFRADKMVATEAVTFMFRLGKAGAPLFASLQGVSLASLMGPEGNDGKTLEALSEFFQKLDPVESKALLIELCEKAEVQSPQGNYEPIVFDAHFSKNVMEAFTVAALVVQVNFADFFGGKLGVK